MDKDFAPSKRAHLTAFHQRFGIPFDNMHFIDDKVSHLLAVADLGVLAGLSPDTVALASGRDFPDALAAASLQRSSASVLLLTEPDGVPAGTAGWFEFYGDGVFTLRFIGGPGAVSESSVVLRSVPAVRFTVMSEAFAIDTRMPAGNPWPDTSPMTTASLPSSVMT